MKFFTTFFFCLAFTISSYAQKALTFAEAKESGIRTSQLDSLYQNSLDGDTAKCVFKTNQDEFIAAYQQMLQDLGKFLKANDFVFEKPTKGFNRIYFTKDGKVDYFIYGFRPDQLTAEQEKMFGELLGKFLMNYRFPLKASVGFAQCSPVTYMPAK